ncbi:MULTISPECIES: component of SufBCD complex [unclassified Ruegeria]|uniref:component of SufBCD complex n=1 Tax=unclassified Ruegeria TaxID=2625375 RepID=UPI00148766A0|nr:MULTISPECIES: component of SufBCD complex [unclassified Ruegeria]NOD77974.1 component of SufBCD complex [Ruegeria sp. HKCCD4332]NOD87558.1 component of SufBCD complex [Ruegeria sp. HKCCD4318]NOE15591.1 component of SufBCD complex [Ruegeria sp. HKCCD4318-2]NOG08718.1 component of SufBCD complex [Ruegeria sp. HKCCD4315]
MDWYSSIFELIDMRSFSNLWYWIVLAVVWSSASHWVMGIPYDLVVRARRIGGQVEVDLLDIVRINTNRILLIVDMSGTILLAFASFMLTGLATLGFYYDVEFAQAVFLLMFPMMLVLLVNISQARRLRRQELTLETVTKTISRCRLYTQIIGMISILVTSFWGMYQNISIGVLG